MKNKGPQISYLLRHNPEGLEMDKEGWVLIEDLLRKVNITRDQLDDIVENNNKKRFGYSEDGLKIRARQGHSAKLGLNIKFEEVKFPTTYYHGTVFERVNSILKHGLKSQNRQHVHLSKDVETAVNVGTRHISGGSTVVVLEIDGNQMKRDGLKLYESENGVILADFVPGKYIKKQK